MNNIGYNSTFIELKYINLLSNRLQLFKKVSDRTYNFRCPICGDSEKNRTKTRGYLYQKKTSYIYHCHNCGAHTSFKNFLKTFDNQLFKELLTETYKERNETKPAVSLDIKLDDNFFKPPVFKSNKHLKKLKKISQLEHDHPAKQYILSREIPNKFHSMILLFIQILSEVV